MKEYTVLSAAAALAPFLLDRFLRTGIMKTRVFWIFSAILFLCEVLVDGFLTSRPVFLYGERFVSGWRIGTTPVEDFLFGFAFTASVVLVWEHLRGRRDVPPASS